MTKKCTYCLKEKSLDDFCKDSKAKDGKFYWCRECSSKRRKTWYKNKKLVDPDYVKKQYWQDVENYRANRIRYYNKNKQKEMKVYKEWLAKNPLKMREYNKNKRAKYAGAQIKGKYVDLQTVIDRDGLICYLCLKTVDKEDFNFDHLIPISRGGKHELENLSILCKFCDNSKNNKLIEEFDDYFWISRWIDKWEKINNKKWVGDTCISLGEKRCSMCKNIQPRTNYSKKSNNKDGLQKWCKNCFSEHCKQSRINKN